MSEHLGAALARAARLMPAAEAVVDGDVRWTYAELDARVSAFDAALDDLGMQHGDVVAVLSLNSAAHLVTWLAIPRSGRVLCDLNFRLAPAELEFILADCAAGALIVDDAFLELGRELAGAVASIAHVVYAGDGPCPEGCESFEALCTGGGARPLHALDPETLAGIFYTGGTTGLPKGAMLSHRNLVQNAKNALIATGYGPDDVYLHAAPMFHLADGMSLFGLTWVGGKHVIQRAFTPAGWVELVEAERVTRGLLVPAMIGMVLEDPALADADLSSLRMVLYGASPMPAAVLARAMAAMPCGWAQGYGMTEAAPLVTMLTAEDHRSGDAARLRSAGRPIVGVEVEVRRADGVTPCEIDEPGEVYIRGANIMQGYWNRPEETAVALVEGHWYRSGDAAFVDADGYVHVVDRVKDMIVSGGENVYSTEVENALHRHEAVLECAVFGIPSERWGEQVHATVVLREGAVVDAEALTEHCRTLIAGYKLPRSIAFAAELPKSGAGKILKRDLRAPYWEGRDRQIS
jgi:long-chain acyl-CoA synthetase